MRLELLKQADQNDRSKNVVLFDQSAKRLLGRDRPTSRRPAAQTCPTTTVMDLVPGDLRLKEGSNELQVRFESPEVGGVKLAKIYTFKRGDYVIGVRHEVINNSGAALSPRLYLQLVRDGNPPEGESSSTSPSPARRSTPTRASSRRSSSRRSRSTRPTTAARHHRRERLGGDGAALLRGRPAARQRQRRQAAARVLQRQGRHQHLLGGHVPAGGRGGAGSTKAFDAQLYAGPQEENKLAALAPGWSW